MATDKVYDDLVLNVLTEEQYKNLAEKDPDQIYLTETKGIQQYEEMPEATAEDVGKIVQYVGDTTDEYAHGCFYQCVSDGASEPTYSWQQIDVQKPTDLSNYYTKAETNTELDNKADKASDFITALTDKNKGATMEDLHQLVPVPPAEEGTFTLKATRAADGTVTTTWVKDA